MENYIFSSRSTWELCTYTINWRATTGWRCQNICSFLQFITGFLGYYLSWMLLTSHCMFENPTPYVSAVLAPELFIGWPALWSCEKGTMVWFHQLQTSWSLAIMNSVSDSGWWQWVISERKRSSAHSLVSPVELALNPVLKNALLSNSRYFWKAPQLFW